MNTDLSANNNMNQNMIRKNSKDDIAINQILKQADTVMSMSPDEVFASISEWQEMMTKYNCAIREIRTKDGNS